MSIYLFMVLRTTAALREAARTQNASYRCRLCWLVGRRWTENRSSNRPLEGPKSTLGGSKIDLRAPWAFQRPLRTVQEPPKTVPRAPKIAQEPPKSAPRASQERPKSAQVGPKRPPKAPRRPLGEHFEPSKLEKRAFRERCVARLAGKACSEGFFGDFRSERARANMRKTY